MDAHFNEYLAAVVGMQDLYGHPVEDHPTEFHGASAPEATGPCSPDFCSALGGTA